MELIQPEFLETIDFDLLTAEIFQQHEFVDYTLTDPEQMQLDWRENDDDEMIDEVFDVNNDEKSPTCDAKNDEPKVDEPQAWSLIAVLLIFIFDDVTFYVRNK